LKSLPPLSKRRPAAPSRAGAAGFRDQPGLGLERGRGAADPPPPGAHRTAVVTGLEATGAYGDRRGFRAALRIETGGPGGPVAAGAQHALVVLAEGADGRWRVVMETSGGDPDLPVGEE